MIRLKRKTGASYFWLKPDFIYCCLLFLVTYAFLVDADTYNVLYGVRTKDINVFYLLVYYISGLLFLAGTTVSKKFPSNVGLDALSELEKTYKFLIKLTFLAYGIWFARFAAIHGFHALISFYNVSYVSQKAPIFRIISGRIGGLTTMTEFGVVVAPLAMMFYQKTHKKKHIVLLFGLFFLAVVRSVLFSERLAFLELAVPVFCVYVSEKKYRKFYEFLPFIGVLFVLAVFAIEEYGRSWLRYYAQIYPGSYFSFIVDRLLGYYTIAINTECSFIQHTSNLPFPFRTMEWMLQFPFSESLLSFLDVKNDFGVVLRTYGNAEFNNPGGMLVGVADFGMLGMVLSFLFGYLSGAIFKSYKKGYLLGRVYYPIIFLCLIELPRYFYFGSSRGFFVLLGMIVVYNKIKRIGRKNG